MEKTSESCHVVLSFLSFQEAGRSRAPESEWECARIL